uniref:Ras-like protein family member 11A n=1 Tax=Sus scrofa TaxID=9823 RepID=A0A480IJ28_PIG
MSHQEEPCSWDVSLPQGRGGFGLGGQNLLEAPLQVLHVGGARPRDDGGSSPLPGEAVQLAHFLAEMLKHITDVFVVFTGGNFQEEAAQLVGQLDTITRLHLPGVQKVPLVAHDDDGGLRVGMDLPDVLVQGADGQVAVIVCDGIDQQEALCPLHALGQRVHCLGEAVLDLDAPGSVLDLQGELVSLHAHKPRVQLACIRFVIANESLGQEAHDHCWKDRKITSRTRTRRSNPDGLGEMRACQAAATARSLRLCKATDGAMASRGF